jgi:hypothetical protein
MPAHDRQLAVGLGEIFVGRAVDIAGPHGAIDADLGRAGTDEIA